MTRPWPTKLSVREGLANAVAGRRLAVTVCATVALVTGGVGLANALEVSSLVDAERRWIDAGAFVFVVEPGSKTDDAGIDVSRCDRLSDVDGIDAAFAVTVTESTVEPAHAPGTRATLAVASPGVYEFLGVRAPATGGILVPPPAATSTGLADGEHSVFVVESWGRDTHEVPATAVLVDDGVLAEQLVGAYLLPTVLTGEAKQCYVRTDAAHVDEVGAYLRPHLADDDGTPALVRPRLAENSYGLDFENAYGARVLRWAWAAGAAMLVALWAVLQWSRRAKWAIYATFGADARARLTVQSAEWLVLSAAGSAWGWGMAVSYALGLGAEAGVALTQVTGQVVATWCAASVGAAAVGLLPVGTLLDALKDRT
ncbi:hypothetical protein ACT17Q_12260 [Cellulomonas sp. CW35]|uniref:hypothetical protein n=1 Tax=unclassified Cellulomonas TaxID=2620175 RepID=UPI000B8DA051|nr:hypothetical protein [Cellulomonas sp. PSBB021]ASR53909.1 hypothetical protein CBP52_00650 [Cellulomonas sp. PSBB021]